MSKVINDKGQVVEAPRKPNVVVKRSETIFVELPSGSVFEIKKINPKRLVATGIISRHDLDIMEQVVAYAQTSKEQRDELGIIEPSEDDIEIASRLQDFLLAEIVVNPKVWCKPMDLNAEVGEPPAEDSEEEIAVFDIPEEDIEVLTHVGLGGDPADLFPADSERGGSSDSADS